MSKIKIGMISYEHIHAEFRSRALSEMGQEIEIVAIADDNEARGRRVAPERKHPTERQERSEIDGRGSGGLITNRGAERRS